MDDYGEDSPWIGEVKTLFEFPDGFEFEKQHDWLIVDGSLVHDPLPEPEPAIDPNKQRMDEIEAALCELAEMITGGGK